VIRDSGVTRTRPSGAWINEQRWTVSHKATSIRAACIGLGYAWFPEESIREELDRGRLKPLPLVEGGVREATLYLVFADREASGPGARRLAEILREQVAETCRTAARGEAVEVD
jgi:DNA-binding transcriptional LysR family regulator